MSRAVLLPQESPRDAATSELAFHMGPVRPRSRICFGVGRRKEGALESVIIEAVGQGPSETGHAGALEIAVHGTVADLQGVGDQAFAEAAVVLEAEDVSDPAHGQSLGGHRASSRADEGSE